MVSRLLYHGAVRRYPVLAVLVALGLTQGGSPLRASPSIGDGPEPPARPGVPRRVPGKPGSPASVLGPGAFSGPAVLRVRSAAPARAGTTALGSGPATGTLSGKTVYLSPGHGWDFVSGAWHTQRGNTNGLVEDFITAEGVDQYLIPYLRNMGAYVVPLRESDMNPNRVVVDDVDATLEGDPGEVDSTDTGWGPFTPPIDQTVHAFARGGARRLTAAASETGRAVYAVSVPESGAYNVYVSYVEGADRVPDAHYIVRHAGGEAQLRVDQRRHGSTWVLLGRWWFDKGAPVEESSVVVANDSAQVGAVISLDAVRLGGGMGMIDIGGGTTGRPAFETDARFYTQILGAPDAVYDYFMGAGGDDVVARPRFAAWDHEDGEDAIYLAWHTNAPDPGRGTTSISYGNTYPCCSGLGDFAGTAGSLELQQAVHEEVIGDLRADFAADWTDDGRVTASLGELRPSHNPEMPAVLVELAFHDTPADADALREPRFRRLAARAMAEGIARYFASKDGRPLVLPPEPPTAVRLANDGAGGLVASWRAPADDPAGGDAATGYRIYVSKDGYGFDDGTAVEAGASAGAGAAMSAALDGLGAGDVRYVRVTAVNDGGESLPTEVVGARVAAGGTAPVLVVGGFDRLSGDEAPVEDLSARGLGMVQRMVLDQMNDGSYAARHGAAIAAAGYSFDGATDDAIEAGDVALDGYQAVDWFTGEDAAADAPLADVSRAALGDFLARGGHVLLSGTGAVAALTGGSADEQAFAMDLLHTGLVADDADTYQVSAAASGGPLGDVAALSFDDRGAGGYDADAPDVLSPSAGAEAVLSYQGGAGGAAGIAWGLAADPPGDTGAGVVLGFPFEVVSGADARTQLMAGVLAGFGVTPEPDPPGPGDGGPDASGLLGGCGCRAAAARGRGTGGAAAGSLLIVVLGLCAARGRRRPGGGGFGVERGGSASRPGVCFGPCRSPSMPARVRVPAGKSGSPSSTSRSPTS